MAERPVLVILEGVDCSGKTTQAQILKHSAVEEFGISCEWMREPGNSQVGARLRDLLLDPERKEIPPLSELFIFSADRAISYDRIRQLKVDLVVLDRSFPSTLVYQGYVGNVELKVVEQITEIATYEIEPDLVIVIDVSLDTIISRIDLEKAKADRNDSKSRKFFKEVRDGYLTLADRYGWQVIDGSGSIEKAREEIWSLVGPTLEKRGIELQAQ